MIRISVTELESYRYFKEREDMTVADLVADLRHEKPPTPQMEAGRAFALFMETARHDGIGGDEATVDGWRFIFDVDAELELPDVRELKAEASFQTPSGPVTLVGKVDGLGGLTVHDQKLTEKWDAERYLDSLQWRAYLVMFKATTFVYDVFVGRYDSKGAKKVTVTGYERMPFYAYPEMRRDVERAVTELAGVIARYLPERVAA